MGWGVVWCIYLLLVIGVEGMMTWVFAIGEGGFGGLSRPFKMEEGLREEKESLEMLLMGAL